MDQQNPATAPQPQEPVKPTTKPTVVGDLTPINEQTPALKPHALPPRYILGALLAGAVSFVLFIIGVATSGLAGLFVAPIFAILPAMLIMRIIGKASILQSFFVSSASLYLFISIVGYGLPAEEKGVAAYISQFFVFIIIFLAHAIIFQLLKPKKVVTIIFFFVLLCVYSTFRTGLFIHRANDELKDNLTKITFNVYKPESMPQGFTVDFVKAMAEPLSSSSLPRVTLHYRSDTREAFNLEQFPTRKDYNPPKNCGNDRPLAAPDSQDVNFACVLIGHSNLGCDVYREEKYYSDYEKLHPIATLSKMSPAEIAEYYYKPAFCEVDGTLLTLGLQPRISNKEVVSLFDSLKKTNPIDLYKKN